jgi:hypothetical protein
MLHVMKVLFSALCFLLFFIAASGQQNCIDKEKFFTDPSILQAGLVTQMGKLLGRKAQGKNTLTARFIYKMPDSSSIDQQILVEARGHFRRENCYIPPLKFIFNKKDSTTMSCLQSLKLVSVCKSQFDYSQYLLKEFLVYKIYNLLTEKSFRVRLLDLEYKDSSGKKRPMHNYAFFIEDAKEMARRNNCKEWTKGRPHTEQTNRRQMTLLALFEYMIGNTDWAVPVRHNIKTIISKDNITEKPFSVPYDFDYCGLVNAEYAIPDEILNITSVVERVYRGFPRSMEELNEVLTIFNEQKENIYSLINGFELLNSTNKKRMINYLEEFYSVIKNPYEVKLAFIENARKE